jgi:hypothetical protein
MVYKIFRKFFAIFRLEQKFRTEFLIVSCQEYGLSSDESNYLISLQLVKYLNTISNPKLIAVAAQSKTCVCSH